MDNPWVWLERSRMRGPRQYFTGLYFNTNKTGDIGKSPEDRGHVVPWQNERVLRWFDRLRTFQEIYNPIVAPTKWTDLVEDAIRKRYAVEALEARGAETFLFRDPCSPYPDQPVVHTRLTVAWNKLCAEAEERLAAAGEVAPGGARIKLVARDAKGKPSGTVFNLHSLRVTMITAWAEQGVPIDILMKVAGHASAIMTIYYQKQSVSHVTEVLNKASHQTMLREQDNWQAWITQHSYEDLTPLVASLGEDGPLHLKSSSSDLAPIVRRDHGLCPVGCSRCHEGGDPIEGAPGRRLFNPVPGGAQNCVRCRFFVTGPAFLLGLVAHFDEVGFRYREASRVFVKATKDFEALDYQRKLALSEHRPFDEYARLNILASTLDQRTREVDELAKSWHATYRLIEQSIAITKNQRAAGSELNALVSAGGTSDLEYSLEVDEAGEREFELLDKICQNSVFFSVVDSSVPNLHRMRYFDSLLQRNGIEPAFFQMTEEEALAAGNAFARLLYTTFGRESTNNLMSGAKTLASLGIGTERMVAEKLSQLVGRTLQVSRTGKIVEANHAPTKA